MTKSPVYKKLENIQGNHLTSTIKRITSKKNSQWAQLFTPLIAYLFY